MAINVKILSATPYEGAIYELRVNGRKCTADGYWEGPAGFTLEKTEPKLPKGLEAELEQYINDHSDEFAEAEGE